MRICRGWAGLAAIATLLAGQAWAQTIVPPMSKEDPGVDCLIKGLDYDRDGVLKLRAGPGTGFEIIGVFRNGDVADVAAPCQGRWCYVENGMRDGKRASFRGWIHNGWCQF